MFLAAERLITTVGGKQVVFVMPLMEDGEENVEFKSLLQPHFTSELE